jgi:hypothetical protein
VLGGAALEAELAALLDEIARRIAAAVPARQLRAALLIGGYGRGEGGVLIEAGRERPHNNFDLLLITTPIGRPFAGAIKRHVDRALAPLARQVGLGIDTGVIGDLDLALAPNQVMWCDVRASHRVLLGSPGDVAKLFSRFVEPALEDVSALLVNRATLLAIDELLLDRVAASPTRDRAIVRHAMKAVVGYGDAWLASRGRYHSSYLEKRDRIRAAPDAPAGLRARYDAAIDFRLRPSYETFERISLRGYVTQLRAELAPVHLAFERHRLGRTELDWSSQPRVALAHAEARSARSPRAWAGAAWRQLRGRAATSFPLLTSLPLLTPRDRLSLAMPGVLYDLAEDAPATLAARMLGLPAGSSRASLRDAYLSAWGRGADPNFGSALQKLGVDVASLDAPHLDPPHLDPPHLDRSQSDASRAGAA